MARGRFISNAVIEDSGIHDLSSDTSRLAYIFLITLADREGRITGELGYLTSKLFPRRREITTDMVKNFIIEWANAGFVVWYEDENEKRALQLINFEKHQRGLRKDREPVSEYANPEGCRILAGTLPAKEQQESSKDLKDKNKNRESLINNVNVNANPAKNDGENPDLIRQNDGNTGDLFDACVSIYEAKKGKLVTDGQAFAIMINNFKANGVTAQDYAAAIDAMDADGRYKGGKPTSYEKWAIGYAEKRKNPVKPRTEKTNEQILEEMYANGEL